MTSDPVRPTTPRPAGVAFRTAFLTAACLLAPAVAVGLARLAVLGRPPFTDDGWYASIARLSRAGFDPLVHSPVTIYPRTLSFAMSGDGVDGLVTLRLIDGAVACVTAAIVSLLLGKFCGMIRGCLIACVWAAAANSTVFIDAGFKNQILAATGLLAASLCCVLPAGDARASVRTLIAGGMLAALAVLVRESFAPFGLVATLACLARNGPRRCATFVAAGCVTGLTGLSVVAGGPHRLADLAATWSTTAAALSNFAEAMGRPWSAVFIDSGQQALRGASWVTPLMLAALIGGLLVAHRRPLRAARLFRGDIASNRRLAPWLGAALVLAPMPEMALKLCFPYHFAQLLLGCAVLAAARLDGASLRRSRSRITAIATITITAIVSGTLLPANLRFSDWSWRESAYWRPVMLEKADRPELVADSFYLRLADAVRRHAKPGDVVLTGGLYYTLFALTDLRPASGLAADAGFIACLPEGDLKRRALDDLQRTPPNLVIESNRIPVSLMSMVPGFPQEFTLAEELAPGSYNSYRNFGAKIWVRVRR
ncbi:MAG: hypothetical protein RL689_1815 [Planctomycetota bacterium]|jgi:hypothetical protein